jgi:DNA-binding response OmpR family regulator
MPQILVVEDDWRTHQLYCLMLEKGGYATASANDAREALTMFERNMIPDLILLDIMLPGMDGVTFCKMIRAQKATCEVPVLIVSARADHEAIEAGFHAGANAYLPKPILRRPLVDKVRELLRPSASFVLNP